MFDFWDESNLTELQKRFWLRVSPSGAGCWEWLGAKDPKRGYALLPFGNRTRKKIYRAHRLAYMMAFGFVPAGIDIHHLCRNTGCVNPYHLQELSKHEHGKLNKQAMLHGSKTHCKHGHPFSPENTLMRSGKPGRTCLTCSRLQGARSYAKGAASDPRKLEKLLEKRANRARFPLEKPIKPHKLRKHPACSRYSHHNFYKGRCPCGYIRPSDSAGSPRTRFYCVAELRIAPDSASQTILVNNS